MFGVFVHAHHRLGTALGDRAQGLLQDRGETARLVAGGGVVVHLAAKLGGVVLPPVDALDQLFADLAGGRAARQQMLCAVHFRCLGQDSGAAVAHQDVHRRAKRRIGGNA